MDNVVVIDNFKAFQMAYHRQVSAWHLFLVHLAMKPKARKTEDERYAYDKWSELWTYGRAFVDLKRLDSAIPNFNGSETLKIRDEDESDIRVVEYDFSNVPSEQTTEHQFWRLVKLDERLKGMHEWVKCMQSTSERTVLTRWYTSVKPAIERLVGFYREADENPVLKTTTAYEIVTQYLYAVAMAKVTL